MWKWMSVIGVTRGYLRRGKMEYKKCKDCRWVEFIDISQVGNIGIEMMCKITGKSHKLQKCIKDKN